MATAASTTANLATCAICLETCENPTSLPCLHAFCLKCLQDLFRNELPGNRASCPTCRQEFKIPQNGVGGLRHRFIVQQVIDHNKQELDKMQGSSCEKHKDKQVELYCHGCKVNICGLCYFNKHKGHEVDEILKVADNFKLRIADDGKEILSAISCVREQSGQTRQDTAEFRSKVENVKKKVLATGDVVKRSVDDKINNMLKKLESLASESDKQSESVQEAYQLALVSMESFHADSRKLLDKGRPSDITRAGCELHERAKELLTTQVTAVQYHPPYMDFTPADVMQIKCLNLIGELGEFSDRTEEKPKPKARSSSPHRGKGQKKQDKRPKQASDKVAALQDKLIQAADREKQLQMRLDKTKNDASQLQEQLSGLQREFEDFKQRSLLLWEQEMKQRDMGCVIHTLSEGEPVSGVTSLESLLYVLRSNKSSEQIKVYDIDTYRFLRCLTVRGLGAGLDIVACKRNRCAYISDCSHESIHRLALPDATGTQWSVGDKPARLSLTDRHGVLVSCSKVRKIKEFSTDGQLLNVLTLPQDVVSPWHSIQLSSGQFIVCHGSPNDPSHCVCLVGYDGSVIKSFGGAPGSGSQHIDVPIHMAVDRNEFVFVVDINNRRVLLLSPLLTYVRDVVTPEQLVWWPRRVHLDSDRGRLYVADNEYKDGKYKDGKYKDGRWTDGRVVVVSV